MNNFDWALRQLKQNKHVRRTDWGWPDHAYLELVVFNGNRQFYLIGQYLDNPTGVLGYGLTFGDIDSNSWEIVE